MKSRWVGELQVLLGVGDVGMEGWWRDDGWLTSGLEQLCWFGPTQACSFMLQSVLLIVYLLRIYGQGKHFTHQSMNYYMLLRAEVWICGCETRIRSWNGDLCFVALILFTGDDDDVPCLNCVCQLFIHIGSTPRFSHLHRGMLLDKLPRCRGCQKDLFVFGFSAQKDVSSTTESLFEPQRCLFIYLFIYVFQSFFAFISGLVWVIFRTVLI